MNDVELAIAAAGQGAGVVRSRFGSSLERKDKGAGDFATNADVEAEAAMAALLHRERPLDTFIGEETGQSGEGERTWFVDPLCGTLNYAAGMRVAAVNVALRVDGRLVAAAVADPFSDEIFYTDAAGAFRRAGAEDTRLAPDGGCRLVDLNLDPPFPNAPAFKAAGLTGDPVFEALFRPRVVSSTMALTWVATGQRAAYVTDGDISEKLVHFAAGLAICQAAGCVVTNLWGEAWGNGATGLIAAADSGVHSELLGLILPGLAGSGRTD